MVEYRLSEILTEIFATVGKRVLPNEPASGHLLVSKLIMPINYMPFRLID
jgi:hypothetical protein